MGQTAWDTRHMQAQARLCWLRLKMVRETMPQFGGCSVQQPLQILSCNLRMESSMTSLLMMHKQLWYKFGDQNECL